MFVGGVLCTLSAWPLDSQSFVARVRAGAEGSQLPLGLLLWYHGFMKKKTLVSKKRRGPVPTGVGKPQVVRMHDQQIATIDSWIAMQDDGLSRPEAIRRLVEIGLKAKQR